MKELLPEGSSVVALEDAQHHLMLDKPLEFVDELDKLIKDFFQFALLVSGIFKNQIAIVAKTNKEQRNRKAFW